MKFKKIFYLLVVLIFLTACKKDQSHEIKFSTGEVYKFESLSVEVIADEEKMTTREIFSSKDNEEKLAYDLYYDLQKEGNESPLEFAIRNNWELYMYQMFCIDYLIPIETVMEAIWKC